MNFSFRSCAYNNPFKSRHKMNCVVIPLTRTLHLPQLIISLDSSSSFVEYVLLSGYKHNIIVHTFLVIALSHTREVLWWPFNLNGDAKWKRKQVQMGTKEHRQPKNPLVIRFARELLLELFTFAFIFLKKFFLYSYFYIARVSSLILELLSFFYSWIRMISEDEKNGIYFIICCKLCGEGATLLGAIR